MLLAADIGNTRITLGLYDNKELLFVSGIATNHYLTCDQYAVEIKNILSLYGYSARDIDGSIISSVVPDAGESFGMALRLLSGVPPVVVGPGIKTGLNIKIDNPAQLGGDLVVGAVAANALYPLPVIIFDFGTATKVSVINAEGVYLGCAITAGLNISIDALSKKTATLPRITLEEPKNLIGTNSADSMKSGLVYGAAALIDFMSEHIEEDLGKPATLVATGGLAHLIYSKCRRNVILNENLLLEGLRFVYEKNNIRPAIRSADSQPT